MIKQIARRFMIVLYVLWGVSYLLIVINARQVAAPMMNNPAFVLEMVRALLGAGIILVLTTIVTFIILRIVEQGPEKKIETVETSKIVSIEIETIK